MDNKTSEIAKLTERISRDPKSKLFVPLAEEYKKAGDINMSIHVLTEGLKNNPGYVTARSFLGKLLIEKGDLPSAQKEFEEVIRAIPDNLMAQRKLADLYALQDRLADAAVHYKIALTLNPKDTETATLLAKAEAGHDVKSLLRGIRPADTPEPHKPHASIKPVSAAAPVSSQPVPEKQPSVEPQNVAGSAAAVVEEEVPEEVLVVEPLDSSQASPPSASFEQPSPGTAPSAPEIPDFLSEAQPESEPTAPALEQESEDLFSLNEPAAEPAEFSREPSAAEEGLPVIIEESPAAEAGQEEAPAPSGLFEEEQPAAKLPEEAGKQADDFTTDTLAELYISQGFFEKAVDIYERMLVDNPSSLGLKDKLTKVRAMAAASPSVGVESETIEAELVEEHAAGGLEPDRAEPPSLDAGQPAATEQEHPRLDAWEMPATKAAASPEQESWPAKPGVEPNQFDAGFEPREYIPPDAVPVSEQAAGNAGQGTEKPSSEQAEPVLPSPKLTAAGKKETVDRLEKWLKNIRKEN